MRISEIEIRNFRGFEYLRAEFNEQLTVIVGNNGAGKSSLLDAVSIAVSTFLYSFKEAAAGYGIAKDDVLNKCYSMGSVIDLQPQYPASIAAKGVIDEENVSWKRELNSTDGRTTIVEAKELTAISEKYHRRVLNGDRTLILPILSYYGTGRLWAQKKEKKARAQLERFSRQAGYIDCLAAASNEKMMLKWFEKMTIQQAQNNQISPEFSAVKQAMSKCFQRITGYDNVTAQFNLDTHSIDMQYLDGKDAYKRYPMKDLSDGYKNTLSMIADIAYRMAVLNPQLFDCVLDETPGIVLIDEVDLHLHPLWQQQILEDLTAIFPQVQFIVSTHAPSVISSVKKENILILNHTDQAYIPAHEVFGSDANSVLSSIMSADERPPEIKAMFHRFYDAQAYGKLDEAERVLNEIKELIGADDPELTAACVAMDLEKA